MVILIQILVAIGFAASFSSVEASRMYGKPFQVSNEKKPLSSRAVPPSYSSFGASRRTAPLYEKKPLKGGRSGAPSSPQDILTAYALSKEGRKVSDPHSIPQEVRTAYYDLHKRKIYEAKRNYDAKQSKKNLRK